MNISHKHKCILSIFSQFILHIYKHKKCFKNTTKHRRKKNGVIAI